MCEEKELDSENGVGAGGTGRQRCFRGRQSCVTRTWRKSQRDGTGGGYGTDRVIDSARGTRQRWSINRLHAAAIDALHHRRGTAMAHCHPLAAGEVRRGCQAGKRGRDGPKNDRGQQ